MSITGFLKTKLQVYIFWDTNRWHKRSNVCFTMKFQDLALYWHTSEPLCFFSKIWRRADIWAYLLFPQMSGQHVDLNHLGSHVTHYHQLLSSHPWIPVSNHQLLVICSWTPACSPLSSALFRPSLNSESYNCTWTQLMCSKKRECSAYRCKAWQKCGSAHIFGTLFSLSHLCTVTPPPFMRQFTKRKWFWTVKYKWRLKECSDSSAQADWLIMVCRSEFTGT